MSGVHTGESAGGPHQSSLRGGHAARSAGVVAFGDEGVRGRSVEGLDGREPTTITGVPKARHPVKENVLAKTV
jgi:hypothetical protein